MPESVDSGHDTTSTIDTSNTESTSTTLTLGKIPNQKQNYNDDILPKLPSHKFRYSVWHDLRETCLTGDQLHAPRVRAGPPEKEEQFTKIIQDGLPIHHNLEKKQRQNHMNTFENWEGAKIINLCYQELSHEYQRENFDRILNRCQSALTVNLSHNTIVTLKSVSFKNCEYLNLNENYIKYFSDFPSLPKVKTLTAASNCIARFDGLGKLRSTPIQELTLSGNPVSFMLNYRQRVFKELPNLQLLDGIPRLPDDCIPVDADDPEESSKCIIL
ncbi:hypothetical protein ACF0H5_019935 [Mactra antiquata]